MSINHTEILPVFTSGHKELLKEIVLRTIDKTRVYVFIGENIALMKLMTILGELQVILQPNLRVLKLIFNFIEGFGEN